MYFNFLCISIFYVFYIFSVTVSMAMADKKMLVEGFHHGMSWLINGMYEKTDDGNWTADVRDRNSQLVPGAQITVKVATKDTEPMYVVDYELKGILTHSHVTVATIITSLCRAVPPFIMLLTYFVNR
jgi:hypothetical protein